MNQNYEFKPSTDYSGASVKIDRAEVSILYAHMRPESPKGRMQESLVLDHVVVDLDTDHRVLGIEVLLPSHLGQFQFTTPDSAALIWEMYAWNLDVPQEAASVAFDPTGQAYEVSFSVDDGDHAVTYRLSKNVWVRATARDIASILIAL